MEACLHEFVATTDQVFAYALVMGALSPPPDTDFADAVWLFTHL